jgi:amidohydrolase
VWYKISSEDNKNSKHAYGLDIAPSTAREHLYTCEYFRKGLCPSRKRWLVPKSQAVNVIHANEVNRSSVCLLYLPISPRSCHILSREHFKYLDSFTVKANQRVLIYIPHIPHSSLRVVIQYKHHPAPPLFLSRFCETILQRLNITMEEARATITSKIDELHEDLHKINKALHSHPELGYQEHFAHETLTTYLSSLGFNVKKHTYGLDTSFEVEFEIGSGGRLVIICAEYDALPGIGHACGHNLIATSSLATFIATAHAMKQHNVQGRLRLLGTPAEEGGGGKAKLIDAGAFPTDTAAAIMAHPLSAHALFHSPDKYQGLAGLILIASHKFKVEFRGKTAHAAGQPWNGINALDAAVAAYTNTGLLRQQIEPDERIHCVIEDGGTVPNVIPEYTRMNWNVRSSSIERADRLLERVKDCIEAGAKATGCKVNYIV